MDNLFTKMYIQARDDNVPIRFVYFRGKIVNGFREIRELLEMDLTMFKVFEILNSIINISYRDMIFITWDTVSKSTDSKLKEINQFISQVNKTNLTSPLSHMELRNGTLPDYQNWKDELEREVIDDMARLDKQLMKLDKIKNINQGDEEIEFKDLQIYNCDLECFLSFDKSRLHSSHAFSVFNYSTVSEYIPVIQWNMDYETQKFKVYENLDLESFRLEQSKIVPETINFTFSLYNEKSKRNFNYPGIINLDSGNLQIKIPPRLADQDLHALFKEQFEKSFPRVKIEYSHIFNIKGSFTMFFPDSQLLENIFQYVIMTNTVLNNFYFHDITKTRLDQKQLVLSFKGFRGSRSYYLKSYISISASVKASFDELLKIDNKVYRKISIRKAENLEELYSFQEHLRAALKLYSQQKENVIDYFNNIIASRLFKKKTSRISVTRQLNRSHHTYLARTKIDLLQQFNREMFSFNNARGTSCGEQPIIIEENEVEDWTNFKVGDEDRQVLKFPPVILNFQGEEIQPNYYVCPTDEYPYLYFKENSIPSKDISTDEHLRHLEKYPYTIKCIQNKVDLGDLLQWTFEGKNIERATGRSSTHISKTNKIIKYNSRGQIPNILKDLMSQFSIDEPNISSNDFLFYGSDISGISFLESIYISQMYEGLVPELNKKINIRMKQLEKVREDLVDKIRPETYIQELYDLNPIQIRHKVSMDPDFSSELYIRGLEEYFSINILVFRPRELKKGIKTNEDLNLVLEVPRNHTYHIRVIREDRPIVCVYKTMGSETDKTQVPHYQWISGLPGNVNSNIYHRVFDYVNEAEKTFLWSHEGKSSYQNLICRVNPSNFIDWFNILPKESIFSQMIDGFGKTRIVNILTPVEPVTIIIPPTSSLGVKFSDQIYHCSHETIVSLLGEPEERHISGYWYKILDYEKGIFVPVRDVKFPDPLAMPPNLVLDKNVSNSGYNKYIRAKQSASILLELIDWTRRYDDENLSIEQWFEEYVLYDNVNPGTQPDFLKLDIFLPKNPQNNTLGAIESLESWWPDVFNNFKIHIPTNLKSRLLLYFTRLEKNVMGLDRPPQVYLTNIPVDFNQTKSGFVFNGYSEFKKWINLQSKSKSSHILDKINIDDIKNQPVLYRDKFGKIYMIQRLRNPLLYNAVMLSVEWYEFGHNPGIDFNAELDDPDDLPPYVEYQIIDDELTPVEDHSYSETFYHTVIVHEGSRYFGMLPLL